MDVSKQHLRHCILFCFELSKSITETTELLKSTFGDDSVSYETVRKWFGRFREKNFSLKDDDRVGGPQTVLDKDIQNLLDENPKQTQKQMGDQLGVDRSTISRRLSAMGIVQREGKWVPNEL